MKSVSTGAPKVQKYVLCPIVLDTATKTGNMFHIYLINFVNLPFRLKVSCLGQWVYKSRVSDKVLYLVTQYNPLNTVSIFSR